MVVRRRTWHVMRKPFYYMRDDTMEAAPATAGISAQLDDDDDDDAIDMRRSRPSLTGLLTLTLTL